MTEDPGQERVDRARGLTRGRVYSRSSQLSAAESVPASGTQRVHLLPTVAMTHHLDDKDTTLCELCADRQAAPGDTYCAQCNLEVFWVLLKALGRTALRLAPEAAALAAIIFVLPAIGHPHSWLTIPVLCVGIPRAWWTLRKQVHRTTRESADRHRHVWYAQGYIEGIQEAAANLRADLRREIVAQSIPLSPELEEALRGERHPQDLTDSDLTAIQPAVEAVIKRHQQQREAYGIDAGLPYGTDAVC